MVPLFFLCYLFMYSWVKFYSRIKLRKPVAAKKILIDKVALRWLLGFRKLRFSKKVELLQVVLVLRVSSWKNILLERKERPLFPIFSLWNYLLNLNVHSTLKFLGVFDDCGHIFLNCSKNFLKFLKKDLLICNIIL